MLLFRCTSSSKSNNGAEYGFIRAEVYH
uniref:Uncharacterized protein n=1 Tax=Rhizophora mucronata TaxID=61149 RepID=A0A2P2QWG0_RHIMU